MSVRTEVLVTQVLGEACLGVARRRPQCRRGSRWCRADGEPAPRQRAGVLCGDVQGSVRQEPWSAEPWWRRQDRIHEQQPSHGTASAPASGYGRPSSPAWSLLAAPTRDTEIPTSTCRTLRISVEQVGLQEDLAVSNGDDDVGRDEGGNVVCLGLNDREAGHRACARSSEKLSATLQQAGVQVEDVTGVCFTSRRATADRDTARMLLPASTGRRR